jgi:3-hydroxybutyryl-CoA dehydratase
MPTTLKIGDVAEFKKTISDSDVRTFADLTGDQNPLHLDEGYAATTRFGRRIVHGMLVAGLISAVLGQRLPGPGAVYLSQTLKFKAPAFIGDTITAIAEITAIREDKPIITLATRCNNEAGEVLIEGEAVLVFEAT